MTLGVVATFHGLALQTAARYKCPAFPPVRLTLSGLPLDARGYDLHSIGHVLAPVILIWWLLLLRPLDTLRPVGRGGHSNQVVVDLRDWSRLFFGPLCLMKSGAGEGSRTLDLLFTKQLLCH